MKKTADYRASIFNAFKELGVSANLLGYEYSAYIIEGILTDKYTRNDNMVKVVYKEAAREFKTTPSAVERGIRHSITRVFDRAPVDIIEKYFGNTVSSYAGKLTNCEFLFMIAEHIKVNNCPELP